MESEVCTGCDEPADIMDNEYNEPWCSQCAINMVGGEDAIISWSDIRPGSMFAEYMHKAKTGNNG